MKKRVLGIEHPHVLDSLRNLEMIHLKQCQLVKSCAENGDETTEDGRKTSMFIPIGKREIGNETAQNGFVLVIATESNKATLPFLATKLQIQVLRW